MNSTKSFKSLKEEIESELNNWETAKKSQPQDFLPFDDICQQESDLTTECSEKIHGSKKPMRICKNEVQQEILLINKILKHSKIEMLTDFLVGKIKAEQELQQDINKDHLLINVYRQIESLQIAQISESIIKVHVLPDKSKYLVTLDETDRLPKIELNQSSYDLLMKYRDTSNLILSYDKTVNSHLIPATYIFII